ncbi:MAG: Stp1/IreP family PP2C-type Ser/Thr phosphatase [Prevotellaceae bacterium]|jgi:protein phosphatase|nr:Stp1/IreP family PP2C-type Ser/Thr phosphatase [Prevotellaceae bacterium]
MSLIDIQKDTVSATDKGLVRERNEDSCGLTETPNGVLCTVCDGMGGHAGGEQASRIAVDCITQFMSHELYADVRGAMRDALEFANMQILGAAAEHPELQGMGTTACILLVQDDKAWIAHAGDSRIYLYVAAEKRLHRLTKDHSYVQGLVDQGIIYEEEAETHPDKNRIVKALGIRETLNPEVAENPILPARDDIFLVCSDGLSGMVSDKEIEKILADKTDLKAKEAALMEAAKAGGGTDNITFQLARISHSPHRKSVYPRLAKFQKYGKSDTKTPVIRKIIILAAVVAASILAGIWIGKSGQTNPEKLTTPTDPTKIEIKNDSIPTNGSVPDNQNNPDYQD